MRKWADSIEKFFEFPARVLDFIADIIIKFFRNMENETAKNIHSFPGFAKGKRAPLVRDAIHFGDFLTTLPTAPLVDFAPSYAYPMDGNDQVGCCVVAGWDHFRQIVTGLLTGTQKNFTQDEIWAFYKTQNPNFDPNSATNGPHSASDNGMNIQFFLEYLQSQKLILGFARIDYTNEAEMKAAIYLGLGIITGVIVDQAQMVQFNSGVWDNVPGSPVDGGHCIPLAGYLGTPDQMTCITWGAEVECTQPFIQKQMDEAWFVLMQEHVDHPNFRNHFDLAGFSAAVSAITGGNIVIPVPQPPVPASGNFTRDEFLSFYKNTPNFASAGACYDAVSAALTAQGIFSPLVLLGALATIRTEVGRAYLPVRENISQAQANLPHQQGGYNGILGNVIGTNDGYFFRGGGLIQLTGRSNYTTEAAELGVDLVNHPELTLNLTVSANVLARFFKDHGCDVACNKKDWLTCRKLVNGVGINGLPNDWAAFSNIVTQFLSVAK